MKAHFLLLPAVMGVGCSSSTSDADAGGAGGAASSSTSTATSTSSVANTTTGSTGAGPTADCATLEDQTSCEAAGCIFRDATLFSATGGNEPVCENGQAIKVCTFYETSPFQSVATYRRDVMGGRIAMVTPVTSAVMGFEQCFTGTDDLCTCF